MTHDKRLIASERASLLRIYLGESDQIDHRPAFERIMENARHHGLAGATVFRGASGYGANSVIHHGSPWRFSQDLPILIEIVDRTSAVQAFLGALRPMLRGGGLVTLEPVEVVRYGPDSPGPDNPEPEAGKEGSNG